jgi:hypothetical protein
MRMALTKGDHLLREPEQLVGARDGVQSNRLIGLSGCRRCCSSLSAPRSSPPSSIGTPRRQEDGDEVLHLAHAQPSTVGSSVGPSTPQFQLRLC